MVTTFLTVPALWTLRFESFRVTESTKPVADALHQRPRQGRGQPDAQLVVRHPGQALVLVIISLSLALQLVALSLRAVFCACAAPASPRSLRWQAVASDQGGCPDRHRETEGTRRHGLAPGAGCSPPRVISPGTTLMAIQRTPRPARTSATLTARGSDAPRMSTGPSVTEGSSIGLLDLHGDLDLRDPWRKLQTHGAAEVVEGPAAEELLEAAHLQQVDMIDGDSSAQRPRLRVHRRSTPGRPGPAPRRRDRGDSWGRSSP